MIKHTIKKVSYCNYASSFQCSTTLHLFTRQTDADNGNTFVFPRGRALCGIIYHINDKFRVLSN